MAIGGIAEIFAGVEAEGKSLEDIATPLSAEEADGAEAEDPAERDVNGRIQGRVEQRTLRERSGARRYRPGPGAGINSSGVQELPGTAAKALDTQRTVAVEASGPA
jgi:hypothetical protein